MKNMAHYRCYFLGSAGGSGSNDTIECIGDEAAIDIARNMLQQRPHHHGIELWKGLRRVHQEFRIPVPVFVIRSLRKTG